MNTGFQRGKAVPEDLELKQALLKTSLQAAVPLWVATVRGYSPDQYRERCQRAVNLIAGKGDLILYRSKKTGGSSEAFNALAEALAILSFAPGGVKLLGLHFETQKDGSECF
jgi:hypothetical protein